MECFSLSEGEGYFVYTLLPLSEACQILIRLIVMYLYAPNGPVVSAQKPAVCGPGYVACKR